MTAAWRSAWAALPTGSAKLLLVLVLFMPVAMGLYYLVPAGHQGAARAVFSTSIAALSVALTMVLEWRNHPWLAEGARNWAVMTGLAGVLCATVPIFAVEDVTLWWRTLAAGGQTLLVGEWAMVLATGKSLISRRLAAVGLAFSGIGLLLYLAVNFMLEDPLKYEWAWGVELPKGITARTLGAYEPWLGPACWAAALGTWLWWVRHEGR